MGTLADFTTVQLQREIIRRMKAERDREEPKQWCHDCKHFVAWREAGDPPDDYNTCAFNLTARFFCDVHDMDPNAEYGFYRKNCSQWNPMTEQEREEFHRTLFPSTDREKYKPLRATTSLTLCALPE